MSGVQGRERLQPSLLDRLTDHAPTRLKDAPDSLSLTQAQLRASVLRDLSALLNTSNLATLEDLSGTPRVAASTLNYGIPGFAGLLDSQTRTTALEAELANAIRAFEPRIRPDSIRIRTQGHSGAGLPALVFEIEAELWAQPVPVQLFLETTVDVETRIATVTETREQR